MADYSQHPYQSLLEFIENGCRQINEERNYAEYLLLMERAESIEELVRRLGNLIKLLAVIHYGRNDMPQYWYFYDRWSGETFTHVQTLFHIFNEDLLKWYKRQDKPTAEQSTSCVLNLRQADNIKDIQDEILKCAGENISKDIDSLISVRSQHRRLRKEIDMIYRGRRYKKSVKEYRYYSTLLAGNGYVFDAVEETMAQNNGIDYKKLLDQYLKEKVCLEEIKRKREEEKKEKRQNEIAGLIGVLFLIILALIILKDIVVFIFIFIGLYWVITRLL